MSFIASLGDWLRKITRSFASASISGQNITLTRHNGDTVVLTTQDTVNNAFTKIKLGTVTLEPDAVDDTLTLGVGAGIQLSANATNDSITVSGVTATQSVAGIMSTADKIKLDGISSGAEVNQNAFSNVKVGSTTVAADAKTDTIELVAGSNVTITPDATNDKITIAATDTIYTHPTTSGNKHIPSGGSSGQILRWSADGTAAWGADNNTTYSDFVKSGSTAAHGLVPKPPTTAGTTKYLREDGTWAVPPDNNTVYTHPTTSGNKHIPSGGSSGQFLKWSSDGTATWANDNNTTYPAFSTARYINAGGYVDAMVFYDNDAQSNRASVIRVSNGNGYHELLLGVCNERNDAPSGLSVRSTNETITASLPGTLTVNGLKIGTSNIGSATKPVYVGNGTITACKNDAYYPSSTDISLDGVSLGYVTASQKEVQFLFPLALLAPGSVKSCSITSVTMHTVNGTKTFSSGFTVSYAQLWTATGVIIRLVFTASTGISNNTPLTVACSGNLQFN